MVVTQKYPYAIIETGGKQYLVSEGDSLLIEKVDIENQNEIVIDKVLAFSDGSQFKLGKPFLEGAKVTAKVIEHVKGPKIISFKKKRRKGYKRKVGHRQKLLKITIEKIKT